MEEFNELIKALQDYFFNNSSLGKLNEKLLMLIRNCIDWYWIKDGQLQRSDHICTLKHIKNQHGHIPELAKILSVHQLISEFCGQQ